MFSEVLEKQVAKGGNSGRVYVPTQWISKMVKVILVKKWMKLARVKYTDATS